MHMHVPTKLHQHVLTGEVGRKSTGGGEGRGTSEWYFGWLAKKPFHLEKTMQHTSWAAIMIWSKCTITPGSWQHSRPEHTRMLRRLTQKLNGDIFITDLTQPRWRRKQERLRLRSHYTGYLFMPTREAIWYGMNSNGTELEQVVQTHRRSWRSGWSRGFGELNLNTHTP